MSLADASMVPDVPVPTSLITVLVIAVVALAGVVAFLFKYYSGKHDQIAAERTLWAVDRVKLEEGRENDRLEIRAEYEAKHRLIAEESTKSMRALYDSALEHNNAARREYLANMETVAAEAAKAHARIGAVLEKALDRFVGSAARKGGS